MSNKKYSELIKAAMENIAAFPATLKKGLMYFDSTNDRPGIDDGTDVSQLMLEKHLPEARRDTKVQLDEAGTGNEIEGVLPTSKGGTNQSVLLTTSIPFVNVAADALDTDAELVWDNVSKRLKVGTGSFSGQAITVYGGFALETGTMYVIDHIETAFINCTSTDRGSKPAPPMTEAQRDAIGFPGDGEQIYNTDTKRVNSYDGLAAEWIEVGSGAGGLSFWQNELSADLNTDGVIGDLAVTGLTIGEKYKVTLNVRAVRQATALSEIQEITFSAVPTYGTWEIEFDGDIVNFLGYDITASELQQKFEDFAVGAGNCAVSGDFATGFTFSFGGALANTDVPEITINASSLVSGETGGTNEVQDLVFSASPTGGSFTISYDGATTAAIPYNATPAQVKAALELLININNVTVVAI